MMEFEKCFVFTISLFFLIKNFRQFSDKIYNPYNKAQQKCLEFFYKFDQVKQDKKTTKMLKK